jgi:soluble lytic murein transglycosylase-like protein
VFCFCSSRATNVSAVAGAIAALMVASGATAHAQSAGTEQAVQPAACTVLASDARLAAKFSASSRSLCSQAAAPYGTPHAVPQPVSPIDVKAALGFEPSGPRPAQQMYLYERAAPAIIDPMDVPVRRATPPDSPRTSPHAPTHGPKTRPLQGAAPDNVRRALALSPAIDAAARQHDIDPLLLHAIARVESRHNTNAVSHAGARGVMQVMPMTGRRFGVQTTSQLHHPATNINVSATYLKTLQQRFGNNLTLVLAAYNAGEGAVERYGRRVPPFAETQGYVRLVLAEYQLLRRAARHAANERGGNGDAS